MKKENKFDTLNFILPIILISVWIIIPLILDTPKYLIPSFKGTIESLVDFIFGKGDNIYSGKFLLHAGKSGYRVLNGFLIALVLGIGLGVLSGYFETIHRIVDPTFHWFRMIPGIGWLPLSMVWFGVGNKTTIFLIALNAFFPIYFSTSQSVYNVPEKIINAAKILGAGEVDVFKTVILESALPGIFSGVRQGLASSWSYLVIGELTGVNEGLGQMMMNSRMLGNLNMILVCMLAIALCGKLFDLILLKAFKTARPGDFYG